MEVKSIVKNTGTSPRKMRVVIDMVRGKGVEEALTILKFAPSPHATVVAKLIKSAVADAETAHNLAGAKLKVVKIMNINSLDIFKLLECEIWIFISLSDKSFYFLLFF